MRKDGKISKVAFCDNCGNFILACHVDYLTEETEKEFIDYSNEGYHIKLETGEETRNRDMGECGCPKK